MSDKCELLDTCAFFHRWKGNTEGDIQRWREEYCEDKAKSESCARKIVRQATGKPPADNFSPTGELLL
jgi:hypothetical protein